MRWLFIKRIHFKQWQSGERGIFSEFSPPHHTIFISYSTALLKEKEALRLSRIDSSSHKSSCSVLHSYDFAVQSLNLGN